MEILSSLCKDRKRIRESGLEMLHLTRGIRFLTISLVDVRSSSVLRLTSRFLTDIIAAKNRYIIWTWRRTSTCQRWNLLEASCNTMIRTSRYQRSVLGQPCPRRRIRPLTASLSTLTSLIPKSTVSMVSSLPTRIRWRMWTCMARPGSRQSLSTSMIWQKKTKWRKTISDIISSWWSQMDKSTTWRRRSIRLCGAAPSSLSLSSL